ncbi:membrane protein [Planomonospora sphaerica]|uniref:Membrane protein n=1 Tax=Planomonospora sphaerica TaxID=161355 RepID=A0A161LXU3_9ACTN|nr:membrane protein [Planomonospora sphaerica]
MSEISRLQRYVPARQDLRVRLRLSVTEFLLTPLLMVLGAVALALGSVLVDMSSPGWSPDVRNLFLRLFPHENLVGMLRVIATGLVTVTTLTISALLVAISHTATTVAPVVFDQFLRRRANQAYFGYVAGCATYTYLVMAVSRPRWAGVGALLAVVLAAGALVLLVFMAYVMIDQMRPTSVVRSIQDLAFSARLRQLPLLARSRTRPVVDGDSLPVTTRATGYVVDISTARLEKLLAPTGDAVEVAFQVRIGDLLAYGDTVARIRGGDEESRRRIADDVLDCVTIDRVRNADVDPDHAIEQLGNIAWAATSTRQNPDVALASVGALRDLSARCAAAGVPEAEAYGGPLPVVYDDALQRRIVAALVDLVVVSTSSRQHQTCAVALSTLAEILPQLPDRDRDLAVKSLQRALPATLSHVASVEMGRGLARLRAAFDTIGREDMADQVRDMGPRLVRESGLEDDLIDHLDDNDITGPRPFRFR